MSVYMSDAIAQIIESYRGDVDAPAKENRKNTRQKDENSA
jgi:hypothetical protein